MNSLRKNHLLIAGLLFAIATILYIAGSQIGAVVVLALGTMVELVAWVTLLTDRSEGDFPPS